MGQKKKKFWVDLLVTCLLFIASLVYIHRSDLRVDTRLSIELKVPGQDIFRLFIDDERRPLKAIGRRGNDFQEINFHLPKKRIERIRLMPGRKPGTFVIKRVKIKGLLFKESQWSGQRLQEIINLNAARLKTRLKNYDLHIRCLGNTPEISFTGNLVDTGNQMAEGKSFYNILAVFLSLVFFYLVHNLDFRNLRIFTSPRTAVNMVLIFVLIIYLPVLDHLFQVSKKVHRHPLQEKRVKARKPDFRFDAFFRFLKHYQYYYDDHFAFRSLLIPLNNFIKVRCFRVSPLAQVVVGKDGWLFLGKQNEQVDEIEYFRAIRPFSQEELEHWRISLEQRRDWLAARGIHYLFIVAPNKSTIYPEFLPARVRPLGKKSRLDQLIDYLQNHSDLSLLDLRPIMLAAKKEHRVYRQADSHWNQYGAYLAYRQIMTALARFFPDAVPLPLADFEIREVERSGGDLAIMLSLQNSVYREKAIYLESRVSRYAHKGKPLKEKYPGVTQSVIESPRGELPHALMVHDSFAFRLKSYLSEHFSKIIYLRDWDMNFYPELIKKENIKLVIEQTTERFLMNLVLNNPL